MSRNEAPCLNCQIRHPGCHGSCGVYGLFDILNQKARHARSLPKVSNYIPKRSQGIPFRFATARKED